MAQTKEEKAIAKKASQKKWREKNKEKIAIYGEIYREKNKEKIAIKKKAHNEANREKIYTLTKAYIKTPKGKRNYTLYSWKIQGAIGDLKTFYDERYLPATKCEVCENEFKSNHHKHMDHCHTTGEIRWVLCASCNNKDYWRKVLERKEEPNS